MFCFKNNRMGNDFSRTELIKGMWDNDLDKYPERKYEFISKDGYKCEIKRNHVWTYCGYVILPKDHPFFKKKYQEIEKLIDVHGGLTYGEGRGKFGFDCHHILMKDISPLDETMKVKHPELFPSVDDMCFFGTTSHYWTYEDTKREVERMSKQFKQYEQEFEKYKTLYLLINLFTLKNISVTTY